MIVMLAFVLLASPLQGSDWLDLKLPSMEVSGSLVDVARQLQRYGIRVCVEDVTLQPTAAITGLRMKVQEPTVRGFLEALSRLQPDIGWASDHFLMCPSVRLFRRSSVNDARNPLNARVKQFHVRDADLYDIAQLVYDNCEEFRSVVNPSGLRSGYAGSRIGGTSSGRRVEIRYVIEMDGWTVRDLLNCLACVSVNNGVSWLFQYDSGKAYPDNFVLTKF
jgi:hypothetical protein